MAVTDPKVTETSSTATTTAASSAKPVAAKKKAKPSISAAAQRKLESQSDNAHNNAAIKAENALKAQDRDEIDAESAKEDKEDEDFAARVKKGDYSTLKDHAGDYDDFAKWSPAKRAQYSKDLVESNTAFQKYGGDFGQGTFQSYVNTKGKDPDNLRGYSYNKGKSDTEGEGNYYKFKSKRPYRSGSFEHTINSKGDRKAYDHVQAARKRMGSPLLESFDSILSKNKKSESARKAEYMKNRKKIDKQNWGNDW